LPELRGACSGLRRGTLLPTRRTEKQSAGCTRDVQRSLLLGITQKQVGGLRSANPKHQISNPKQNQSTKEIKHTKKSWKHSDFELWILDF
jgi:hypothetical protein